MWVDNSQGRIIAVFEKGASNDSTVYNRKPDGTLITTHIQSMHPTKTKPGLGTKSNVLFNFVQGVTSKRKSVIARDRELVKMLTEASVRGYPPGKYKKKKIDKSNMHS